MNIIQCIHTQSKCYKRNSNVKPKGIVVHSTGANNTTVKRYTQPSTDDPNREELLNIIGTNTYNNHWNKSNVTKAVHYFIGKLADGSVATVQNLPEYMECYGCGKGSKGSYNYDPYSHIQFEICEDNLKNADYFRAIFKEATELCADICKRYGWKANVIVSHKEAHAKGYGSNHSDIDHWLAKFQKTMNDFRTEVQRLLDEEAEPEEEIYEPEVGEVVNYVGTVHYSNANSTSPKACKSGEAKVTRTYKGLHPYHLVNTAGDKDGVYGWVDGAYIRKIVVAPPVQIEKPETEPAPAPTEPAPTPEPEIVTPAPAPETETIPETPTETPAETPEEEAPAQVEQEEFSDNWLKKLLLAICNFLMKLLKKD